MSGRPEAIEWIEDQERFFELEPEWDRLAEQQRTPFLRHAWFSAWWRAFGDGAQLRICALWKNAQLAGLFPLYAKAGELHAMANEHTPVFKPFARSESSLARTVEAALAGGPAEIVIPALPASDMALDALLAASTQTRRQPLVMPHHTSPSVDTACGWSKYNGRLSSKTRSELGRLRRKMEREHHTQLDMVCVPSDLSRELREGFEVEASGWKGRLGTAVLSAPETTVFYGQIAAAFHREGRLRLSSISLDGKLVAFDLGLLDHNRLYGLKFGYDESFRRYGPGMVLQLAEIKRCCELGLDGFELLGDADEYKRRFSTSERPHRLLRLYARRPLPLVRYACKRARPILGRARARAGALRARE
jgi:CelD/BcsL family acetyltransferase involved in cellulose biosynthesis